MKHFLFLPLFLLLLVSCVQKPRTVENLWPSEIERYWVGPEFWSVPAMEWKLDSGKLICLKPGNNKGVVMLTKRIVNPMDGFEISFEGGFLNRSQMPGSKMGIMLGLSNPVDDSYSFNKGIFAGIAADGHLMVDGKISTLGSTYVPGEKLIFYLEGVPKENGRLQLLLRIRGEERDNQLGELLVEIAPEKVKGGFSLFVESLSKDIKPIAWYESLEFNGAAIKTFAERSRGPVLTIDKFFREDTLAMNVALAPVLLDDKSELVLQSKGSGEWITIASPAIDASYKVQFALPHFNKEKQYRIYTRYIDRYGSQKYQYVNVKF